MIRLRVLVAAALVLGGCASLELTDRPETSTSASVVTTTSVPPTTTTVPPTTTTTLPVISTPGQVVDGQGQPIARASITTPNQTIFSGADGSFTVESADPMPLNVSKGGWLAAEIAWTGDEAFLRVVLEPMKVRGLRVSGEAAGDDAKFASLLDLAAQTAINTLVFDTKQEGGEVVYATAVSEAHEMGAVSIAYDPAPRIAQAHSANLYTITRIVTFEDRFRVNAFPQEKLAGPWVDPRAEAAWDYNIALAVEACELGFDEIQFDYVRFPSGKTARVSGQLDLSQDERVGAISGFLARAREALVPLGCGVSADVFGIILATQNDQGLGQRPEEISAQVDALSPMVYPSHYSLGWLGFADPNDHPYDVTANAIEDALPRIEQGTELRPWLQAFWWTNAQIRTSIQAAEDRDVGWMLWNVSSNFDRAALPTVEEVTP